MIGKDPANPKWDNDAGVKLYFSIMKRFNKGGDPKAVANMYGMAAAHTMVEALRKAGPNPTRKKLLDAAAWKGEAVEREDERVERAQRALRNDGESQPYFLVFGALYVAVGAAPWAALLYFPGYALARIAHTWLLLRPRQPHRTRVFGLGLVLTLALAVHVGAECVKRLVK